MSKRAPDVTQLERRPIGNLGSALDTARPVTGNIGGESTERRKSVGSYVARFGLFEGGISVDHTLLQPLHPA